MYLQVELPTQRLETFLVPRDSSSVIVHVRSTCVTGYYELQENARSIHHDS